MAGFGNATENNILELVLRGNAYTPGAGTMLSLHTADPTDTGSVGEVAGGTYSRQACVWAAASGGVCALNAAVEFPGMPACTVTYFGVWTAGGVFVGGGPCTNRTLIAGDSYRLTTSTQFSLAD
jgi:hypothetical protein